MEKKIKELHARAKALKPHDDWKAKGDEIANGIDGEIAFINNPLSGYTRPAPRVHVYKGIELIAEILGAEVHQNDEYGELTERYNVELVVEKDGVEYFQLEDSWELEGRREQDERKDF